LRKMISDQKKKKAPPKAVEKDSKKGDKK
jgi:hypothetical protein